MKILLDHQTFTNQTYGGISRYFYELFKRFGNTTDSAETSLLLSNNSYLNSSNHSGLYNFFPNTNFKGKQSLQSLINQTISISKLKSGAFDIFHPTYYNPYFLNYLKGKPFVVTFFDMIHEKFETKYPELKNDPQIFNYKKQLALKATKVIAISESTKNDIIDIYDIPDDNIEVIYLGSSLIFKEEKMQPLVDNIYILFVGNRGLYKNFNYYLQSIAELLKKENILFVCAGGGAFTKSEFEMIAQLGLQKLVKFFPLNDEVLVNLYSNALLFVFPSLYEGFGIPVLEAFSCNCPCLLSDSGSLKEVGGKAALYFNATSYEDINLKLQFLLNSKAERDNLCALGKERLSIFSWDNTFADTLKVYQSII